MAYIPTPKKYPKSPSASRQTGGKAKESMPGVRGSGEMKELKGTGKSYVRPAMAGASAAGRGRGGADSMPKAKAKAKTPDFKVGGSYRSGRTIQGATGTKKRVSRAGAAREGLGSATGGRRTTMGGFGMTMPKKSAAGAGRMGADKVAPMRPGTGTGTGYKPKTAAGRGKGADAMGSATAKSSSAKAGAYAKPKAKVSRMRSMY